MKTNFSKESNRRLFDHVKAQFVKETMDRPFGNTESGLFGGARVLTHILFWVNILFYTAMALGTYFAIEGNYAEGDLFPAYLIALMMLVGGYVLFRFHNDLLGGSLMLVSAVVKYGAVYQETGPFDFLFVTENPMHSATTMFYMHFLPMALLFILCLFLVVTTIVEQVRLRKRFENVCQIVYSLGEKSEDSLLSQEQWDEQVENYLSGDYKPHHKLKRSLRKKKEKNEQE